MGNDGRYDLANAKRKRDAVKRRLGKELLQTIDDAETLYALKPVLRVLVRKLYS